MVLFFALILLTAPTVNPWYWLPLMPLSIAALHHERVLLVTPWIGSFTLLLGYVSGAMLMELGLGDSRGPFSVAPAATLIQVVVMGGAFAYDLFTAVSGRDRFAGSTQQSTLTQT